MLESEQNKRGDMAAELRSAHDQELEKHRAEIERLAQEKASMADDHGEALREHQL